MHQAEPGKPPLEPGLGWHLVSRDLVHRRVNATTSNVNALLERVSVDTLMSVGSREHKAQGLHSSSCSHDYEYSLYALKPDRR